MNQLNPFVQTLLATLPLTGMLLFNILDVRSLRTELNEFRKEHKADLKELKEDISKIKERLAILEERDRIKLVKN